MWPILRRVLKCKEDSWDMKNELKIRKAQGSELIEIGRLMVEVYSQIEGFPKKEEQEDYYNKLLNIGELTKNDSIEILVAVNNEDSICGAVVYFGDMKHYGSGGIANNEHNAAGIRFLAVKKIYRNKGIGKILTLNCIEKAKKEKLSQMILHTTRLMQNAWGMYERIGFKRSVDLDFKQGDLEVFGFRYQL